MALCKEITEYRKCLMKLLCSDQKIVSLLTDKEEVEIPYRDLMYTQLFPYAYNPDVVKTVNSFLCFSLLVPEVYDKTYKNIEVSFYAFCHQSLIRTKNGLRPDLIGEALEDIFNGSLVIGLGRMKLKGMADIDPVTNYHGILLQYSVLEFNRPTMHGDKGR